MVLLFWGEQLFSVRRRRNQVGFNDNTVDDVGCCADAVAAFEDAEAGTAFDQDLEPCIDPFGGEPFGLRVLLLELPVQLVIDDAIVPFFLILLVRISGVVVVPVGFQPFQQSDALDLYFRLGFGILEFDCDFGVEGVHDLDAL